MADILEFKPRHQLQEELIRHRREELSLIAADTAQELVKEVMPYLIKVYGSYGIRFNDNDRWYKHFSAIQLLLYIHTCDQVGFEHPMIDYLDEVAEEIDAMLKTAKSLAPDPDK